MEQSNYSYRASQNPSGFLLPRADDPARTTGATAASGTAAVKAMPSTPLRGARGNNNNNNDYVCDDVYV